MCKIDLHTHSEASPDGSLRTVHYHQMLESEDLYCIAVTDHNRIDFAQALQAELGDRIIVGEEITTTEGEIIGLYLQRAVPGGKSLAATVRRIKQQNGLVYVPHPFETVRKGLSAEALATVASDVDIMETRNGRAIFQNRGKEASVWAKEHDVPGAASSDAHGVRGWGKTYTILAEPPNRDTLVSLLRRARLQTGSPGIRGVLYPKFNRLRKKPDDA
jgi:predicted metal-dependent phosphoesterase TrpH